MKPYTTPRIVSSTLIGLQCAAAILIVAPLVGQENPFPQVRSSLENQSPASNGTPSASAPLLPGNRPGGSAYANADTGNRQYPGDPSSFQAPMSNAPYSQRYEAPLGLQQASWTYIPPPPVRTLKLQDIVTIRVDELARLQAEGSASSRKNSLYNALLRDWIKLRDGKLQPDLQQRGDPRAQGSMNSLYRADSEIESRESLSFNIAARIVDIRPNGNLVLEAHKTIFKNENVWETYLSGICRSEDVGPDNVVMSRDMLDLQIRKNDRGRMRDGYKRGWFTRWFDTLQPF
ncbi:MAG: flagellar basal body L-ring protein FlgH [Pirellulaceae bacterium]